MELTCLLKILILFLCLGFVPVQGHPHDNEILSEMDHETHLYFHLLDDHHYVKELRPASGINDTVVVTVDLSLTGLQGLDETSQELGSSVLLLAFWKDPRLRWNVTLYGGIQSITVPSSKIWKPDLRLLHTQYGSFEHFGDEPVVISYDGMVSWSSHVKIRSHCPLDISDFPFDTHVCRIELAASSYTSQQIHLQFLKSAGHVNHLETKVVISVSTEWEMTTRSVEGHIGRVVQPEMFEFVSITVQLSRKSQFYHCVIIGPAVLLAIVVPVVFLLPAETSGKTTLGVLILTTLAICLKMFCDVLGPNRSSAPRIAMFYVATMALTSVSVIMAAVVMSTARRGSSRKAVPDWLSAIFLGRCGLRRWLCMDTYSNVDRLAPFAAMKNANDFHENESDVTSLKDGDGDLKEVSKNLRVLVGKYSAEQAMRDTDSEWREIALVADRLLFIIFVILFMLTTLALLT